MRRPETSDVEFRVLGPVEVMRGGEAVALGRGTQLDLLVALLMAANEAVPADTLTETVWSSRAPAHPRAALHNAIARLRRVVDADLIETLPHGYRLRADADHLDLLEFNRLLRAADHAPSDPQAEALLAEALGLWRGKPLQHVESPVLLNSAAAQLTDRYVNACERWAGLCLRMGRHEAVVTRLAALVAEHPFREQLVSHFILALYRSGRQAEALAAYDSLRRGLSGEMGIEPGAALQDLYLKIVRADPSLDATIPEEAPASPAGGAGSVPAPVPRQLPVDLPDFCGRDAEARELTQLATEGSTMPGETRVIVISGPGGVGKTALAVHVAHRLAEKFTGGQLFADLNGVADAPVPPAEVLASFLRALGVAGQAMPHQLSDRMTMYRSLTAERRMLIVLDNAASESQLRPLLPANAGCTVIVTSRARITGLPGARAVNVNVLDDAHAFELLAGIIGRSRAVAEADDARALAALCGGLPLALRIAGARLAARTHWPVARLADRLADTRRGLNELVHGDLDVRASFALSYRGLDDTAKAMLCRVSLLAAPDFPAWAGAALLDVGAGEAEDVCERLVDAQLLDPGPRSATGESRYRMHDLVRAFARERAVADEPPAAREAGLARAFSGWLELARRAHRQVYGGDFTILHGRTPVWTGACGMRRAIEDDPLAWLDGERRAIAAAIQQSAELGLDELCWDLAWTSVTLYEARAYFDDWIAALDHALAAVRKAGNERGTAAMLCARASMLMTIGQFGPPRELAEESLRMFTAAGDVHGCAIARYRLIVVCVRTGELDAAIAAGRQALCDVRAAGDVYLEAGVLRELAAAHIQRGEHDAALDCLTTSLRIWDQVGGNVRGRAMTLHMLGELHLRRGDIGAAEETFRQVLAAVQTVNDIVGQAHTLLGLGETLAAACRGRAAEQCLNAALTSARQSGQRIVEARVLLMLGRLNARRRPGSARTYLSSSLAIFTELALPRWQEAASAALSSLGEHDSGLTAIR